jgi:hypothetical protein
LQVKVSTILAGGFVFLLPGIGGIKMAWWCMTAGASGAIILPLPVISKLKG